MEKILLTICLIFSLCLCIGFKAIAQNEDEVKEKYVLFIIQEIKKSPKIAVEMKELLQPIDEVTMTKDLLQIWDYVTSLSINERKNKRTMQVETYRYIAFIAVNRRTPHDAEDDSSSLSYKLDRYQIQLAKILVTAITSENVYVP